MQQLLRVHADESAATQHVVIIEVLPTHRRHAQEEEGWRRQATCHNDHHFKHRSTVIVIQTSFTFLKNHTHGYHSTHAAAPSDVRAEFNVLRVHG